MRKQTVMIADPDQSYAELLSWKFAELCGNQIDLQVITDTGYFQQYFSSQQQIDIILIHESWFDRGLKKHLLEHVIVLSEGIDSLVDDNGIICLNKYMNMRNILNEAVRFLHFEDTDSQKTKLIAVVSEIGGAGKTSIAYGLALHLSRHHRKVLLVSSEESQSFQCFLSNKDPMPFEAEKALSVPDADVYHILTSVVRTQDFTYVPPLKAKLDAFGLDEEIYLRFLEGSRHSNDYEYIIMDCNAGSSSYIVRLVDFCDFAVHVVLPDIISQYKCNYFRNSIDCTNTEKIITIGNRCHLDSSTDRPIIEGLEDIISCYFLEGDLFDVPSIQKCKTLDNLAWMFL